MERENKKANYKILETNESNGVNIIEYYKNNCLHNDLDEPAFIKTSENTIESRYYKNGELHREGDKPAIIKIDRESDTVTYEEYRINGKLHRRNGPAIVTKYRLLYYVDNQYHRLNGPAIEYLEDHKYIENSFRNRYFIHGKQFQKDEHLFESRRIKIKKLIEIL